MGKEWSICIIVILFVVISNIITQNYTDKAIEVMEIELEELKGELMQEVVEEEKIKNQIQKVMETWKKKYQTLAYFIEHDELEKVETELTALGAHIEIEEYREGVEEVERSIFILNHIKEKFKFDIKNIF